ncbi:unnamed protein product, partial [Brachionus calyciflorus]
KTVNNAKAPGVVAPKVAVKTTNLNKQQSGSQESLISEKSSIFSTASGVNKTSIAKKPVAKPAPVATAASPSSTSTIKKTNLTPVVLQVLNIFLLILLLGKYLMKE